MTSIFHFGAAGMVVATFLVSYGVKEEGQARLDRIDNLKDKQATLEVDIALLEAEWRYLNSPEALNAITASLPPSARNELTPAGPDRLVALADLPMRGVRHGFRHGETLTLSQQTTIDWTLGFVAAGAARGD